MPSTVSFQSKILSRPPRPGDYDIYRAGLEWDLTDPIVIETAEDFKSTPRWHDRVTPFHHQVGNLITFCRRLPVTLLADDVGLGKTISAGLILSELIARGRVARVLIVCPKVLGPQWQEELHSKFDIRAEIAIGRDLIDREPSGAGAVITTYNSARLYLDQLPEDRFEMLILDEAHKLRNLHGVPNAPQVAKRFYAALEARRFRFVLMLTATPIQNRLWDLYSLVDLLTVARGHENPFGTPGMFARRFIADERDKARHLKTEAREAFRSIVYGYMSRVRRGDAKLYFPERVVQMHRVRPTPAELQLIEAIAEPIQNMNRLAQISILQALASSPHALAAQLINMARKGTAPAELAIAVGRIVTTMPPSAKLNGLEVLIERLMRQNPDSWRLVVFTTRRETQTTIQNFLEQQGLTVGIINGDSGERNQDTISRFRQTPPGYRVIVSTEAGSEGVNLQVANVLVNYDLPWNPMIVEQRIGRVQRLASAHKHVSIFNIMLAGTFEEYIVGRLMEKLQMATHAVGDIESLLQGADVSDDVADTFEERILTLVLAALAGKDVKEETRLAEKSIEEAKQQLEFEEANINAMLGGMDGMEYVGPRPPALPTATHTMDVKTFTLSALPMLGARVGEEPPGVFVVEQSDGREHIVFDPPTSRDRRITHYTPQAPAFQRLVKRVIASGMHDVNDADQNPGPRAESIARHWIESLGAKATGARTTAVTRSFDGHAILRVRATVAHDSYERLVSAPCNPEDHRHVSRGADGLAALERNIRDAATVGLDTDKLRDAGERDDAIAEFSRFYLERREEELKAAGTDQRKRKKLEDDFTPRLDMTLAGLQGALQRDVAVRVRYAFPSGGDYESDVTVRPSSGELLDAPETGTCEKSGQAAPKACLTRCEASGSDVLQHLLAKSEFSGRQALPEFTTRCAWSGKLALNDELEESAVSGRKIACSLLMTSALSGKRAEPGEFSICAFTKSDLLKSELAASDVSGKPYRNDESGHSDVSGKTGHKSEFLACAVTGRSVAVDEAEICEVSGMRVAPSILLSCEVTGKRAIPTFLASCAVTGKHALKDRLVQSSVSQASMLRDKAVVSAAGQFCLPSEVRTCLWSGRQVHPDDLRSCGLTGLPILVEFTTEQAPPRLRPLVEMLDGVRRNADENERWGNVADRLAAALKGKKYRIEAALLSPSKRHLAACAESKSFFGLRVQQVGAIYDLTDSAIVGRLAEGKRGAVSWVSR